MQTKTVLYIVLISLLQLFISCNNNSIEPIEVQSIKLNKSEITIEAEKKDTLVASIFPENADFGELSWEVDDEEIARVDKNGVVSAIANGNTFIVVSSSNNKSDTCLVTVNPAPELEVQEVSINKESITLEAGETSTLTATVLPETAQNKHITWRSLNPDIVTVDSDGNIEAIEDGNTKIVATANNNVADTCLVTVTAKPTEETGYKLNFSSLSLEVDAKQQLIATFNGVPEQDMQWVVEKSHIVKISDDGTLLGIYPGKSMIRASSANGSAFCEVTVTANNPIEAKVGYYYYSDKTYSAVKHPDKETIGVVFQVDSEDKTKGKIVSLDKTDGLSWGLETPTTATDKDNGMNNVDIIKEKDPTLANYPAMQWCDDKNTASQPDNIHWYLPARNELKAIHEQHVLLNKVLNLHYYSLFSPKEAYWSSTDFDVLEGGARAAMIFTFTEDFNDWEIGGEVNNDYSYMTRAISKF